MARRRLPSVEDLSADRQAYVLGMMQENVFPEGAIQKAHRWFGKTNKGFDCLSGSGYCRMLELEALGHEPSVRRGRDAAQQHHRAWSSSAVSELMRPPTDVGLTEAIGIAYRAADEFGLPQTVYRDAESGGWANTNAFAKRLHGAELELTALPNNYFA